MGSEPPILFTHVPNPIIIYLYTLLQVCKLEKYDYVLLFMIMCYCSDVLLFMSKWRFL